MSRLSDIAKRTPAVPVSAVGSDIYDRFASEPETLAVAVVDDDQRPVGLVERHEFALRMASPYGRALYSGRPISLLMDADPLIVDGAASTLDVTKEILSTRASNVLSGFIIVQAQRYLGVANSMALLQASNETNRELAGSFRFLFDSNPIAMCVWDQESLKLSAVNEAALRQYGFSRDQVAGMTVLDVIPPQGHSRFFEMAAVQRSSHVDLEFWTHTKADGSALIVQPYLRSIVHGERPSVLAALFDITERKKTEAEFQRTRAFLDAVIESIPQMLVVKNMADHRFMLINKAGEELIGIPRAAMIGKTDHDLFPGEQADFFVSQDLEAVANGGVHLVAEEPISTPDGHDRILETRKIAVPGPPGGEPFLLTISNDITERLRDAEALREARDAADASNRAKSEFLANMSHEIRTPLNGVIGVADALARSDLGPAHQELVSIIQSSAEALNRVLSDVLDLARVEAGRLTVTNEPFELAANVRQASALFEPSASTKSLRLLTRVDQGCDGRFVGDAVRIKQILFNLLSNAVKFTAEGEVALDAFMDHDNVVFEVSDTGVGFDAARAEALFSRFEQADGSITRRFGGSGLGLAISRDLAELMGGCLSARSTPGRGSTFRLSLPLRRATPIDAAPALEPALPILASAPRVRSLRVLLADDHPINRKVVELVLSASNVQITSVENGAEALAAFRKQRFDVVLMDLQMPVMDGLTAIAALRAFERESGLSRTPAYALSANVLTEHVEASMAAGADGHIAKPITASVLLASLDQALQAAGLDDQAIEDVELVA